MNPLQIISQDVFDKIRSRFQNLEMGDATGAVTIDPAEARFFDFDFVNEGVNLGRVSISLNDTGSLKVYYSQGITENQDEPAKQMWYNFLREMRLFAMRRLLRFDTRDIAKNNLDKNDFQYLATKGVKGHAMNMNESRWSQKSTKKTSRAVRGQTEVIVRHTEAVDELYAGARSQPKRIKAIFIQNRDGERFKYPFIHPAGAFAMAQHVDHGGVPHDPAGKAIVRMSEQIAQLQEFGRHVRTATLHDDATGIVQRTNERLQELKGQIAALSKRQHYESWMETFQGDMGTDDTVLDDVTMEQYKQTFTQTNFKEELAKFFPLIHKIMSETNAIDLEDYVQESLDGGMGYYVVDRFSKEPTDGPFNSPQEAQQANHNGGNVVQYPIDDIGTIRDGVELEDYVQGSLDGGMGYYVVDRFSNEPMDGPFNSPEEAEQVNHNGGSVVQYPIDDIGTIKDGQPVAQRSPSAEFEEWAESVEQGRLTDDQINALKQAIEKLQPGELTLKNGGQYAIDFFNELGIDDSDLDDKFKKMADVDDTTDALQVFQAWAEKSYPELLVALGMSNTQKQPEAQPGAEEQPAENDDMVMPPGANEEEEKSHDTKGMIQEIAEMVKQFYNADNESVGPFHSYEGIAIDIKKKIAEKYGDRAGEQAETVAKQFMEKLTKAWQEKHGDIPGPAPETDGLSINRLKELLGTVKKKVESYSGDAMKATDGKDQVDEIGAETTNIMPAFEEMKKLAGLAK